MSQIDFIFNSAGHIASAKNLIISNGVTVGGVNPYATNSDADKKPKAVGNGKLRELLEAMSEEELTAFASHEDIGWTEDYVAPKASARDNISAELAGVPSQDLELEGINGMVTVPCYMLTVKKWDVDKKSSRAGLITKTPCLKLAVGDKTLKAFHAYFRSKTVRASIQVGDVIAVRKDSVGSVNYINDRKQAVTYYEGAVCEASIEVLGDQRVQEELEDMELASMSKGAQKIVNETSAQAEADAFLAKFRK